jgi:hypothetical protein
MGSLKQQILAFTGVAGIYIGVTALMLHQLTPQNALSIGVVFAVFLLSALITSAGSAANAESNAQRFLLATTAQMLIALFFILIAKYTAPDHFRTMSIHFLVLFFLFLGLQSFFLIRRVRQSN